MVLDGQRARVDFALTPVARKLINVNPNTISWIGLILALVCGAIFYFSGYEGYDWLLVVGALMVIVSGYFDALDGKVAKLSGKAGPKGDYLDHVFDRYADVFMIGGIAFCAAWCNPYLGMLPGHRRTAFVRRPAGKGRQGRPVHSVPPDTVRVPPRGRRGLRLVLHRRVRHLLDGDHDAVVRRGRKRHRHPEGDHHLEEPGEDVS